MPLNIPDDELPMQQKEAEEQARERPRLLAYERLNARAIADSIICFEGEFVIVRSAFRWLKNGTDVISNAYEMFELDQVCDERNWRIVERYGPSIAIVTEK